MNQFCGYELSYHDKLDHFSESVICDELFGDESTFLNHLCDKEIVF